METSGSVIAGGALATIIATSAITLNLTENAGNLFESGGIHTSDDTNRLQGKYADAVVGMSGVSIGLSGMYLIFYFYGLYKYRREQHATSQKIYWTILLLAVLLGIVSSALNLSLVTNYSNLVADGSVQNRSRPKHSG